MRVSAVPVAVVGDTHPIVGRVRIRLNIPGGDTLDRPMAEVIRGIQRTNGIEPTGWIDEQTLAVLDITLY